MDYRIIEFTDSDSDFAGETVRKNVLNLAKRGWRLQGGVSVSVTRYQSGGGIAFYTYAQAMVFEEKKEVTASDIADFEYKLHQLLTAKGI